MEETGVPGENHRPVASHWQTLSHNVVSRNMNWLHILLGIDFMSNYYMYRLTRNVPHVEKNCWSTCINLQCLIWSLLLIVYFFLLWLLFVFVYCFFRRPLIVFAILFSYDMELKCYRTRLNGFLDIFYRGNYKVKITILSEGYHCLSYYSTQATINRYLRLWME
jgi:hypothetical protein